MARNVAENAELIVLALVVSGENGHSDYIAQRAIAIAKSLRDQLSGDTQLSEGDVEAARQGLPPPGR